MAVSLLNLPQPRLEPQNLLLDFNPLTRAVGGLGQTLAESRNRENSAVASGHLANKNYAEAERAFAQMGQPEQVIAVRKLSDERGKQALNELAGMVQAIEQQPPDSQEALWQKMAPAYNKLRSGIPDFDTDAASMGVNQIGR